MSEEKGPNSPRVRGSLFFPILLVSLGIWFLLQNLGIVEGDAWDTFWKLWPLIFVIIGLDSLLKGEGVAGPVFFCGLGVLFLLGNFGLLVWDTWSLILRVWPVMLIAWGLDLVVGRRSVLGSLAALVIVIAILAGAIFLGDLGTPSSAQQVSWRPESNITRLNATLEPAIGSLEVQGSDDINGVVEGRLTVLQGGSIQRETVIRDETGSFRLGLQGVNMYYPATGSGPAWDLTFGIDLPLDLRVEMAGGQVDLDLRGLQLENLKVEMAVGQSIIYLPATAFSGRVSGAVGRTVIYLPENVSVQMLTDTGLAPVSVPAGFQRQEDVYRYTADDDAPLIHLDVSQALGSVVVRFDR